MLQKKSQKSKPAALLVSTAFFRALIISTRRRLPCCLTRGKDVYFLTSDVDSSFIFSSCLYLKSLSCRIPNAICNLSHDFQNFYFLCNLSFFFLVAVMEVPSFLREIWRPGVSKEGMDLQPLIRGNGVRSGSSSLFQTSPCFFG